MFQRLARRAACICAAAVTVCTSGPLWAANDFPVSASQLLALGVQLQRLDKPAQIDGPTFPTKVVLPPQQESVVSAPLGGVVDQLLVSENDTVRAGQALFRMASPELTELQLKLMEAASKSQLAQKTLARERELFSEGIIPERRVQEAQANAAQEQARLRQAQAGLKLAGIDAATVRKMAEGSVLQEGLVLRARSAGVVYGIEVRLGQRVQEAQSLARVADTRRLWLDIQVPLDLRNQMAPRGGSVTVPGRDVAGVISGSAVVASDNQTLTLRAEVTRGAQLLRPGEFVQARVAFAGTQEGWAVPLASVVRQGEQAYVFVRTPTGFTATPVKVLDSAGQSVRVKGNLRGGNEIAAASVIALKAAWLGKGGSN